MQCFALHHQLKFPFWIIKLMLFRISHFNCLRNSLILLFILWIFAVSVNVSSNNGLDLEFCTKFRGIFAVLPIPLVDPYPTHGQKHRHDTLPLHRARLLSAQMLKGYIYIYIYTYMIITWHRERLFLWSHIQAINHLLPRLQNQLSQPLIVNNLTL